MKDEEMLPKQMKKRLGSNDICGSLKKCFENYNSTEAHNICQKYGWTIQYYQKKGV